MVEETTRLDQEPIVIEHPRYLVFVGENYYPSGWEDFLCTADTLDEAVRVAEFHANVRRPNSCGGTWWEVVDLMEHSTTMTGKVEQTPDDQGT